MNDSRYEKTIGTSLHRKEVVNNCHGIGNRVYSDIVLVAYPLTDVFT